MRGGWGDDIWLEVILPNQKLVVISASCFKRLLYLLILEFGIGIATQRQQEYRSTRPCPLYNVYTACATAPSIDRRDLADFFPCSISKGQDDRQPQHIAVIALDSLPLLAFLPTEASARFREVLGCLPKGKIFLAEVLCLALQYQGF